ncbi:hypothetical protein ABZ470_31750 [Streptosporangium sp. NPDC020072]|uniref:hypothetical protein n=1 Tax=Streptosporangium sp. NPDC020072 TaxID=3154788 RepID=UPI00342B46DF
MPDESTGVVITIKDIYDEVRDAKTELRSLTQEVKESRRTDEDHEGRIRTLERWMYAIPISVLVAIVSAVITIYGG